ncbi:hypothetical protein [Nonlabens sp. Asnod3-A02]|uniref:hypothetical protein n=1 Tax=Nonlabens sp. Asnod3-A02 TaxID=3160579 RepID=UPI003863B6DF
MKIYDGSFSSGITLDPTLVQRYEVGTLVIISFFLIYVCFKVKKQTYEQFVESNTPRQDKDFSYLTKDILMQPRSFEHELKGSTKGFYFPIISWNKYFNNRVYFFLIIALIYYLLFKDI